MEPRIVKPKPIYLERRSYRLRRLSEGLLFLQFLTFALWILPFLWQSSDTRGLNTILWIFGVWMIAIVVSLVINRILHVSDNDHAEIGNPPDSLTQNKSSEQDNAEL